MPSGRRPAPPPPPGRVTLEQAAELSGLSYQAVYRRAQNGAVPWRKERSGVITIAQRDVVKIKRREASNDPRRAVMVRVPRARYESWIKAAGNKPVSTWIAELADAAAKAAGNG